MDVIPICTKITSPEIRQQCLDKCIGPSPKGVSLINTKCQLQCNPFVNCLQGWAKKDCDDMEDLADYYAKKLNGNLSKIKTFIAQWNTDMRILTTKPDILRLIGEIVGKFRENLTCFANKLSSKLGIAKLKVPDDLDLGLAAGANAIPKFLVYIIVGIAMLLLAIFVCLPFMRKNPYLNLIPISIATIAIILIIHFFNNN